MLSLPSTASWPSSRISALKVAAVALSLPGGAFLTVVGGFLFGIAVGASAAVIGATIGATLIFLVARTALGEPLLRRAGPRANQLAEGFSKDAFSYLLFLRLVPAFPFFLVNLVAAFAGVRLGPFIAATALGIIPGAMVFALAGIGLDSVITAQRSSYEHCIAAQGSGCHMVFDPMDVLHQLTAACCPRSPRTDADGGEVLARTSPWHERALNGHDGNTDTRHMRDRRWSRWIIGGSGCGCLWRSDRAD